MTSSLPVTQLTVHIALAWLLDLPMEAPRHRVLQRARTSGLLRRHGGLYKVGDAIATRLMARPGKCFPSTPRELGRLLHGLGEIAAWSNAEFSRPLARMMARRRPRVSIRDALAEAILSASAAPPQDRHSLETSSFARWMMEEEDAWTSFHDAALLLDGRFYPPRLPDYGLVFASRFLLRVVRDRGDLRGLPSLTMRQTKSIGMGAFDLVKEAERPKAGAACLIRTPFPGLRHLGAAAVVMPPFATEAPTDAAACCSALVDMGIAPGDAVWMTSHRVKQAVHERYRCTGMAKDCAARLAELARHPEQAMGGPEHLTWETANLETRRAESLSRLTQVEDVISVLLRGLAEAWPAAGLDKEQLGHLEHCFVDTPEIRYRLAVQVPHQDNRRWLLRRALDRLEEHLGLRDPAQASENPFVAGDRYFAHTVPWAVRSAIALFETEGVGKGIGRETARLVAAMAKHSEALAKRPFAAARWPTKWGSLVLRGACADHFALAVAQAMPENLRDEVAFLAESAIDHARLMMTAPRPHDWDNVLLMLASLALDVMAWHPNGAALRERWVDTPRMAPGPRALVLWATPSLVDRDQRGAEATFLAAITPPLSCGPESGPLQMALTVLDAGMAGCAAAGRTDLTARLVTLWTQTLPMWPDYAEQWRDAAARFVGAVEGDEAAGQVLLEDEAMRNSRCRTLVHGRTNP